MRKSPTRQSGSFISRRPFTAALLTAIAVLVVLAVIFAGLLLLAGRSQKLDTTAGDSTPEQQSILFLGVDGTDGSMTGQRSDVITLLRIRQNPSWIDIVSIPRDSLVDLPECAGSHATEKTGEEDKLNSAFAYASAADEKGEGAARAGMNCAAQTITKASGIPIDGTIATTFDGAAEIIDSLDGADLPIDDNGRIVRNPNNENPNLDTKHFTGADVVRQVRTRKTEAGGSDLARIYHQQEIMGALLDYYRGEGIIDSSGSVSSMKEFKAFFSALTNGTATTLGLNEVRDLLQRAASTPVTTAKLPTRAANDGVNVVWNEQTKQFWQTYKDGEDLTT